MTTRPIVKKKDKVGAVAPSRSSVKKVVVGRGKKAADLLPMVLKIVQKSYKGKRVEYQDLIGEGLLGLSQAKSRFDPSKGAKLSTYSYRRISGAIRDFVEKEDRYVDRFEVTDPSDFETIHGPAEFEGAMSDRLLFLRVIKVIEHKIPQAQAVVLVRSFLEDVPDEAIASELGVSLGQVANLKAAAIQHVRSFFYGSLGTFVQ